MNTKYIDLISQTFDFPQEEFKLEDRNLQFHDIDLMELVETYGSPLKFTYLPQISNNIHRAKGWFEKAIKKNNHCTGFIYSLNTITAKIAAKIGEI